MFCEINGEISSTGVESLVLVAFANMVGMRLANSGQTSLAPLGRWLGAKTTGEPFRFVRVRDAKLCVSARGDDVSIAGVSNCEQCAVGVGRGP